MAVASLTAENVSTGETFGIRLEKFSWKEPTGGDDAGNPPPHTHGGHTRRQSSYNQRAGGHNQRLRGHQRFTPRWTHVMYCPPDADVRDAVTRKFALGVGNNELIFTDGHTIRIPGADGVTSLYNVVYVAGIIGVGQERVKRVYLMRNSVTWA
jgi:hypothetical protein